MLLASDCPTLGPSRYLGSKTVLEGLFYVSVSFYLHHSAFQINELQLFGANKLAISKHRTHISAQLVIKCQEKLPNGTSVWWPIVKANSMFPL